MMRRFYHALVLLSVLCLLPLVNAGAQTPVALPYTLTTLAGGTPTATSSGSACPTLSTATATDSAGDGCPAANGVFGAGGRGGVAVDSYGNVFVDDDVSGILHMINPTTGIMTALAGTGTNCKAVDKSGDGCAFPAGVPAAAVTGARGVGIDPYGNVLLAGYTDKMIHVLCRAASPLCSASQVGYMELVAGCVTAQGSGSASGGVGLDGYPASSVGVSCKTSLGETDQPRGATADIYGNVYFADSTSSRYRVVLGPLTSSYFKGNNPLYAVLKGFGYYSSPTAGYVYTIVNLNGTSVNTPGTAQVISSACQFIYAQNATGYTSTAFPLDTYGDGCPFQFSSVYENTTGTSAYQIGVAVDAAGNMLFTDPTHGLRVFFVSDGANFDSGTAGYIAGQAMKNAIAANNATITPTAGYIYMLAGGGSTNKLGTTPYLGNSLAITENTITKVTVSPQGNIYIGDSGKVLFFDIATGYIRTLATTGSFANSNGLGVAVDGEGNLYLYDTTTTMQVRKVLAQGLAPLSLGLPLSQTFQAHFPVASAASATQMSSPNADISYNTLSCGALNGDGSLDCSVTVTATPSMAGQSTAAMTLAASGGESLTLNLGGTVSGSVLAIDNATSGGTSISPTTSALFSGSTPSAVAVDGAGNIYEASGNSLLESLVTSASSTVTLEGGLSATPTQMAVDQTGNIFYLNGSSSIQKMAVSQASSPSTYSSTTISYTPASLGTASPSAIAVDAAGNLFVADEQSSAGTIYRFSPSALSANSQAECSYPATASSPVLPSLCQTTIGSVGAFGSISSLAVDPSGNVYVADTTNSAVYKLTPDATGMYAQSTVSNVAPGQLAVDAAGDLYVQSGTKVTEYPVSGVTSGITVLSGVTTPVGLAVDGLGNVYSADASKTYLTQVKRNSLTEDFGSSYTTEFTATLTNVGNQTSSAQSSANGAEAGDFTLAGCTFSNNLLASMTAGEACAMTAYFPAIGNTEDYDYIAFTPTSPSVSASGLLTLKGLADMTGYDTITAIGTASTSSPAYAASGTEVSFPITVTASGTSTDGTVTNNTVGPTTANYVVVSVDSGAATTYNLTSASGLSANVTLNLSGLAAGSHSFTVAFPQQNSFLASSATSSTITVAQASASIAWSPSAASQYVSAAIGADVLNATESSGIAGNVIYSVTSPPSCTSTSTATVDASTYLAVGSYTLYATFCPADSTNYSASTALISYTVNGSAPTTATVGASTMVLAGDSSSGNYTSLTTALEALPVTGGTIYIKPGTYSGQNAISYPNVQLRGLGGDPTRVILSGENGAWPTGQFNASYLPAGFGLGPVGKGGDEGSATLDVSKSAFIGTASTVGTYIPNNFYAENLTIQNTFDTDSDTTTVWGASSNGSSSCTSITATNLQYLYNNNGLCGAQALALFMNSDGAILNNVNLISQQDTLYASGIGCGTYCTVAREYMWKGLIVGDVDYVFGDAALVFDHTNFFTTWHGASATGQETIEAQNKRYATGTTSTTNSSYSTSSDYLSGFICNACNLMSQSAGMTKLYYGRPWNISSNYPASYSTWVMLNSSVDQVNAAGWIGWDGASQYLNTSTYAEYNTQALTDPTLCTSASDSTCTGYPYPSMLFNTTNPSLLYTYSSAAPVDSAAIPDGGNSGSGVTGTRESYALKLTAATAAPYYPVDFLSTTVPSTKLSSGQSSTWNPVNALAAEVNAFAPVSSVGALAQGSSVTILGRPQTPGAGVIPTGIYTFYDSLGKNQVCSSATSSCTLLASGTLDNSGEAYLTTNSLASGTHYITMVYVSTDSNFASSTSSTYSIYVLETGQVASTVTLAVDNTSSTVGTPVTGSVTVSPSDSPGIVTLYLDGVATTTCTLSSGSCAWSTSGVAAGAHTLYASYPGTASYGLSTSASTSIEVISPVATGDTRTTAATEPSFPSVCQQLTADIADVNSDIPASIDGGSTVLTNSNLVNPTVTNPDGGRIQAALNACSASYSGTGSGLAVELSADSSGNDAFLTGPLSMPSNVTLLVDPGVTLYFSRNAQDYDMVSGTNTCGTINSSTATKSCQPLIDVPKGITNVGIMGYGKLNGRGGDALLNPMSGYSGYSWWDLSAAANGVGSQQNPRFIQMDTGASNITLYKITILNAPLFHVSTTGPVSGFTAWDIKIVTPTYARNTDGIDPGSATNFTITKSWISDGDDNVAVGASGNTSSKASSNISVTDNHFFAGHGESIGSYTGSGVSNVLFDGNMSVGNAWSGHGSAIGSAGTVNGVTYAANYADTNSTAVRIKSANDRGGTVTGIQYSNSCFLDHKADIQFTPYYSSGDSTSTSYFPNYNNILMQNLVFENDNSSQGTVELTGEYNSNAGSPVTNPLSLTMDNVTFPSTLSSLVNSTSPVESSTTWADYSGSYSGGTGQYVNLTVGPGEVSSNFLTAYNALAAVSGNNDTLTSNIALTSLNPPSCTFTYIAPELTGPTGFPQTIAYGDTAKLVVILTPAVGGAAYPAGTVTLTDALTGSTYTGAFTGSGDTITVPVTGLAVGTHTFSVTSYAGDSNYTVSAFGSYAVTVTLALPATTLPGATVGAAYTAAITPASGGGSYNYMATGLPSGLALNSSTGAITGIPTAASAMAYSVVITATDTNDASLSISQTYSLLVNPPTITLTPTTLTAGTFGSSYGQSVSAAGGVGPYTYALASGSSLPAGLSLSSAGAITGTPIAAGSAYSFTIIATDTGSTDDGVQNTGSQLVSLPVGEVEPVVTVSLTSGSSTTFVDNSLTFTAAVSFVSSSSATLAAPTGTVIFYDGSTVLCSTSVAAATCTVNSATAPLSLGSHSITASYSGDTNYRAAASSALGETVVDFTVTATKSTATVVPGKSAEFTFTFSPVSPATSFPAAITLAVSGLPDGATYSFSPATIASGASSTAVTLNIQMPLTSAKARPADGSLLSHLAPFSLALLLLPLVGRLRRAGRRLSRILSILLLFGAGFAVMAGLNGCSSGGFFGQAQKSYTVTVTATSGTLSHSTNVTLTVE